MSEYNNPYSGSDWIKSSLKITEMSPLGEAVADLLGQVYLGIYHLPTSSLRKVDWMNDTWVSIAILGPLCTVDGNGLTRLVVLAHDRLIRVEIDGAAPNYLRLTFHQRKSREGRLYDRCPTMVNHINLIWDHYDK